MFVISWFNDITQLKDKLNRPTYQFIDNRFMQLYQTYCVNGSKPLTHFCLHDYGEILIAEHFDEIHLNHYESIQKIVLDDSTTIYLAAWVRNNDICDDVIIPQFILSSSQLDLLEKEL